MNSNYEWMATNLLRQAGTAIVRAGGHNPQIPTDCSQFFPKVAKAKTWESRSWWASKTNKRDIQYNKCTIYIYIYYIYYIIYIYIVTRSLYIYICIHWYTMIYRYTEKIQKAQDDWRISRLKPFLDQRADGGLREIRQLNPPMSNRIKWDSLGNTLIHLKFILSIILKYIHIYIHICWHISSMLKKNADSLLDASWDHLDA